MKRLIILLSIVLIFSMIGFVCAQCTDSDGGLEYFVKGTVTGQNEDAPVQEITSATDTCDGDKLYEWICKNSEEYDDESYTCPSGCENGACIQDTTCTDSDEGKDYYVKGELKDDAGESHFDYCDQGIVYEYWCDGQIDSLDYYTCPSGCENGACIGIEPTEETGPIEIPEEIIEEDKELLCMGCVKEDKCYPFGYRKDEKYCSDETNFVEYKEGKESCENNFECSSNVCVSGECISEGLMKKILNWFRRLFGGE